LTKGKWSSWETIFQTLKDSFSIFPTDATTKHPVFVKIFKIFLIFFEALSKNKMLQKDIPQNSSFCYPHQRLKS
jgi:hypothetical protein